MSEWFADERSHELSGGPGAPTRVALTFDFDAEEVWIADDPENAHRPGVLSQGSYGAAVGVPSVLKVLEERSVPATFFVPGRVAERYPGHVERMLGAGHEVAHHGYTHRSPSSLSHEEERDELESGLRALRHLGATVTGYRSPSWDFSRHTLDLVEAAGLTYSSNLMDDIRPYRHASHDLIELPVSWVLDDAAHFWFDMVAWTRKIATTDEVWSIWTEEFRGFAAMGGTFVLTMHPQIIGRPSRLLLLARFIEWLQSTQDVRFLTGDQIASGLT
jgi:peptidoglycan/xylan/chitin deacetylase (PgdA/CDA1 family)